MIVGTTKEESECWGTKRMGSGEQRFSSFCCYSKLHTILVSCVVSLKLEVSTIAS